MNTILIEKVFQRGFIVCAQGEEIKIFGSGATIEEALGNLMLNHSKYFGLKIVQLGFAYDHNQPEGAIVISQHEVNLIKCLLIGLDETSTRETIPLGVGELILRNSAYFGLVFTWSDDELTKAYLEEFPQMKDVTKIEP